MSFSSLDADWNPATCQQAMGRIYRQGQAKECIIYRLFTSGTVDEVILQRQLLKQGLSKLTVDSSEGSDAKFSKEELAECFDLKENCICDTKIKLGTNWPTLRPIQFVFVRMQRLAIAPSCFENSRIIMLYAH